MEKVIELYNQGMKMIDIATNLQLSYNTVKSIIRRKTIKSVINNETTIQTDSIIRRCRVCGNPVNESYGKREKHFCSSRCRLKYWRKHHDKR